MRTHNILGYESEFVTPFARGFTGYVLCQDVQGARIVHDIVKVTVDTFELNDASHSKEHWPKTWVWFPLPKTEPVKQYKGPPKLELVPT